MTRIFLIAGFVSLLAAMPASAEMSAEERQTHLASFDHVWKTIRDKHWEEKPGGLDWQAVHDELRPIAEKATSPTEIRAAMSTMLARLKTSHNRILSISAADVDWSSMGDGDPGIDVHLVEGQAVIARAEAGLPVKTGWIIHKIKGKEIRPALDALAKHFAGATERELRIDSWLTGKLSGFPGDLLPLEVEDGAGKRFNVDLELREPRGKPAGFGNLPPRPVFFEYRRLNPTTGYVRFNMFLDPARIAKQFGDAVNDCSACAGLIIDLRGNPGGIGMMATGIAGWLVQETGLKLGTMQTRDNKLKFIVNARPNSFKGKVAVLIDGASASTSEILAGGLKDLGRARIFGTRSAAAALPSMIERLPNGDYFQYAMANYISESGQALEGVGVIPNVEVKLTRQALLAGRDPVIDAAAAWIAPARAAAKAAKATPKGKRRRQ